MRRNFALFIFDICVAFTAHAQISIDGHLPFTDTDTQSYLFVTSHTSLKDYSAAVEIEPDKQPPSLIPKDIHKTATHIIYKAIECPPLSMA